MSLFMQNQQISPLAAILININIMIGAGLFINTTNLAQMVGGAGFISYAILAILLYPLIASIAMLVNIYPTGGFYMYAKQLHPFAGFISAWSYFIGKLSSAMLLIHASLLLLQQIIVPLQQVNIYIADVTILVLFLLLNVCNLKTGMSIQCVFLSLKLIPILFVIFSGMYLLSPVNYTLEQCYFNHLIDTLPFVLFAVIGFEATTSLSSKIRNASKNGPRAIIISYFAVLTLSILYQFFFYGSVGTALQEATTFLQAFPLLLRTFVALPSIATPWLQALFNVAIAASALGGSYGILFSNSWNLHTLAKADHIIGSKFLLKENSNGIPYLCVIAEGALCLLYLILTGGSQISLQQIAAFSCTIAYTMSIISLVAHCYATKKSLFIPIFGLFNCIIFIASCFYSFIQRGIFSLSIFGCLLLFGAIMYLVQEQK